MAITTSKGVSATHPDYDRYSPKWKRVRDCVAGQDAIQAAGEAYLPMLKDEDDKEFTARIKRSDFFNATWRTIAGLGGMAFRKPPTVEVPSGIEAYLDDINLAGVTMEAMARETLDEVLSSGRIFILVDHPTQETDKDGKVVAITKAVAEQRGLRPTIQLYPAESLTNWKFGRVNNAWVLTMAVLKECGAVDGDEYEHKTEERWRVLDLDPAGFYRQRLFKREREQDVQIGGDNYPLMNGKQLTYIPGVIVGADGRGDQIDEPPLIDLVDKNLAHYQVNADYRHGLHFTGLPTLFLSGMVNETGAEAKSFYIGSTAAITSPYPDAKGMFIEFTGQGLGAIEKALSRLEMQMALLGARMIADETAQAETLGATQIKRQGENSVLARIVQSTSEALEWALGIFAEWAGQKGDVVYQINRDSMPAGMDAQQFNAYLAAVAQGEMTSEEFFGLMQRADLIDPSVDYEMHREKLDSQAGPARPVPKAAPDPKAVAA